MLRSLLVFFVLALLPLVQACESRSPKKTSDISEEKVKTRRPARPPAPVISDEVFIKNFSYEPVPQLEAGQDAVSVVLHWQTNSPSCELELGDQMIDVSGRSMIEINVPETMVVRLSCLGENASVRIPVQKKLSIVNLSVTTSSEGGLIRWEAFGASFCWLQDVANGLNLIDQPTTGQHRVAQAASPRQIQLSCQDAEGAVVSAKYNGFEKLKLSEKKASIRI